MGLDDFTSDKTQGRTVALVNISQDHWRSCASGPFDPENHGGHTGPWTAVPQNGQNPSYVFESGDIVLARRTNRTSDGEVGDLDSGVYGIWKYKDYDNVDSQGDHPWNQRYSWYIYCEDVETRHSPIYDEDWDAIDMTPQKMTGSAVFELSAKHERNYLSEILELSSISDEAQDLLNTILDEKGY